MAGRSLTSDPVYRIQVLERAFAVLEVLAGHRSDLRLADLAGAVQLHKSTVHRLLAVLVAEHVVEKSVASGKYRLGSKLIELGRAAVSHLEIYDVARPHLASLVSEIGETAHLAVLRGGEVVSLVNVQSRHTLCTPSTVGARSPAYCTSLGKAMLAFFPPSELKEFLSHHVLKPYTRKTITSVSRLREELRLVRERGYAVDDEEREEGLRCIGSPVRDHSGDVIAAVSIAGPAFRIFTERIVITASQVVRAAAEISAALGYSGRSGDGYRAEL
jgi:IclR family transcriptional regulator, KDG regulon repressor